MFRDISFGQYYPVKSFVHNMDARVKLLLSILFIVGIFFINSYFGFILTTIYLLLVIIFSRVPILSVLKSIKGVFLLVLITALFNLFLVKDGEVLVHWQAITITKTGVDTTIMLVLRLVLLITGTSILTLTTTPVAIVDGLEFMMKPLKYIKIPIHDLAMVMSIALKFIPTLFEETNKLISAQKARGASFDTGGIFARMKAMLPVLIPLFVSAFRRADELAFAMDARCYNATDKRTKMVVPKMSYRDLLGAIISIGWFVVIILDRYYWCGWFDQLMFGGFW